LTAFLAFVGAAVNGTRDVGDVDLPNNHFQNEHQV
jgi:hypothetical protein